MIEITAGAVAVSTVCGILGAIALGLADDRPLVAVAIAAVAVVVAIVAAIGAYVLRRYRVARLARWSPIFDALAEQLGGWRLANQNQVANWLRVYWPMDVREAHLARPGGAYGAFVFEHAGLPCAAGALKDTPNVRARRERLAESGFSLWLGRAGMRLDASAEMLAWLRTNPSALAIIAPVIFEAGRIARLLGAHERDVRPSHGGRNLGAHSSNRHRARPS